MAVAVARGTCGPGASSLLYPAAISRWAEGPQDLTSVVLTVKDSLSRNDSFSRITRLDAAVSYRNLLIAEARGWERQQGPTAGRPGASSFQNLLGCTRTRRPCPPGQARRGCVSGTCGRACAHGRVSCRDGVTGSCLASACVDVTAARSACGSWLGLPSGHRHPAVCPTSIGRREGPVGSAVRRSAMSRGFRLRPGFRGAPGASALPAPGGPRKPGVEASFFIV